MDPSVMKVKVTFTAFLYLLYREAKTGLMEEYGQIKLSHNTNQAKIRSENWLKANKILH